MFVVLIGNTKGMVTASCTVHFLCQAEALKYLRHSMYSMLVSNGSAI